MLLFWKIVAQLLSTAICFTTSAKAAPVRGCSIASEKTIVCIQPQSPGQIADPSNVTVEFIDGDGYMWGPLRDTNASLQAMDPSFYMGCGTKCGLDFEHGGVTYYQNIDGTGFSCGLGADFDYDISFLGFNIGLHVQDWQLSFGLVYQSEKQGGGSAGLHAFLTGEVSKGNPFTLWQTIIGENQTQIVPWQTIKGIGVHVMGIGVDLIQLQGDVTLPDLSVSLAGVHTGGVVQANVRFRGLCVEFPWWLGGTHCAADSPSWPVANAKAPSIGIDTETSRCTGSRDTITCVFDVGLLRDPAITAFIEMSLNDTISGNLSIGGKIIQSWGLVDVCQLPVCFPCWPSSESCTFELCLANVEDGKGMVQKQFGIELKESVSGEVLAYFTDPTLAWHRDLSCDICNCTTSKNFCPEYTGNLSNTCSDQFIYDAMRCKASCASCCSKSSPLLVI